MEGPYFANDEASRGTVFCVDRPPFCVAAACRIERPWESKMTEANLSRRDRPLSPHLQIYRCTLPFLMSGFHRVTGFVLYFGFALIAWWLIAAASGPTAYANVQWFFGTFIGRLVLLGYTWALIHHTIGGIRHLIWDTGR